MTPEQIEQILNQAIGPEEADLSKKIHRAIMETLVVKITALAEQDELPEDGLTRILAEIIQEMFAGIAGTAWRFTREDATPESAGKFLGNLLAQIFTVYEKEHVEPGAGARATIMHIRQLHQVTKIRKMFEKRHFGERPKTVN